MQARVDRPRSMCPTDTLIPLPLRDVYLEFFLERDRLMQSLKKPKHGLQDSNRELLSARIRQRPLVHKISTLRTEVQWAEVKADDLRYISKPQAGEGASYRIHKRGVHVQ